MIILMICLEKWVKFQDVLNLIESCEPLFYKGINAMMRKLSSAMTTTIQLVKKDENRYALNTTILLFSTSQKFMLNEESELHKTADGRMVKITFTIEGNKLIEKQVGEKTLIIEREFFDEELIVTSSIGDVVCKSWCKRVD